MIRTTLRAALALGAALSLAACSGDSGTSVEKPLPAGTFEASITGKYTAAAKGLASNVGLEDRSNPGGWLELRDERDAANSLILRVYFGPRPVPPGTYTLGPLYSDTTVSAQFIHYDLRTNTDVGSVGKLLGTVTIASVSGTTVVGSVDAQRAVTDPDTGQPYNFHYVGRFTAVPPTP